jgi:serine/threonine protein kinase
LKGLAGRAGRVSNEFFNSVRKPPMTHLGADAFLEYVECSGLIDDQPLRTSLNTLRTAHGGELPDDARVLADHLRSDMLLTRWQAERLLEHKYSGYYLGKYKLLDQLGDGETCNVYLAEHVLMKRHVAVKVLPKTRAHDYADLALFHLEVLATTSLAHPHCVRAVDADYDRGYYYLVTELILGGDLERLIAEQGPLPIGLACRYVIQAAEALSYAHDNQLIHGDVQPANLIVDRQGSVFIADFGLALFPGAARKPLAAAHRERTLRSAKYASPEQHLNSHKVDLRTDIYSLGCTFYFLLTGHSALTNVGQENAPQRLATGEGVRRYRPECPRDLAAICAKMRQPRREKRYQTMREVRQALEAWLLEHGYPFHPLESNVARQLDSLRTGPRRAAGGAPLTYRPDALGTASARFSLYDVGMTVALAVLALGWWVDRSYLTAAGKEAKPHRDQGFEAGAVEHRNVARPQAANCEHGLYLSRRCGRATPLPCSAFAEGSQKNFSVPIETNKLASPASAFPAAPLPPTH